MNDTTTTVSTLTAAERDFLDHCEQKIARGLETFREVGEALMAVRDNRLYREQYETFEQYCSERWGFTPARASQLVDAATLVELISSTMVNEINFTTSQPPTATPQPESAVTPTTERQVRPLAPLLPPQDAPPEEKAEAEDAIKDVWREAVDTAPRDETGKPKVTGKHVADTAVKRQTQPAKPADDGKKDAAALRQSRRKPITDSFRDAVLQLVKDVERIERLVLDDRWAKNAAKVAPASRSDLRRALDLLAAVAERVPD